MPNKKLNFYATINRGGNNSNGTKVRLNWERNPLTLAFLSEKHEDLINLHESNPDQIPSFGLENVDWEKIRKELGEKDHDFTKIYYRTTEVCIICDKKFRTEIMEFEMLRDEARRQQKVKDENRN